MATGGLFYLQSCGEGNKVLTLSPSLALCFSLLSAYNYELTLFSFLFFNAESLFCPLNE